MLNISGSFSHQDVFKWLPYIIGLEGRTSTNLLCKDRVPRNLYEQSAIVEQAGEKRKGENQITTTREKPREEKKNRYQSIVLLFMNVKVANLPVNSRETFHPNPVHFDTYNSF